MGTQPLANEGRYPLISTITCEFTHFDDPTMFSAGEVVITSSNSGAVGLISTVREIGVLYGGGATPILMECLTKHNNYNDDLFCL